MLGLTRVLQMMGAWTADWTVELMLELMVASTVVQTRELRLVMVAAMYGQSATNR